MLGKSMNHQFYVTKFKWIFRDHYSLSPFLFVGPKNRCNIGKRQTNRKLTPEKKKKEIFQYQTAEEKEGGEIYKNEIIILFYFLVSITTKGRDEGSRPEKKELKPNVFQILILNITNFSSCLVY
jgi:hypothetical protein